ncbi:MAG: phosphatidate cytidylyltransferase [Planctomycetes bacterium]|nr:phosphatidate cytidylyltransferase [Planctomycetota bacterium]
MLRWRLILGGLFIAALVGLCVLDYRAALPGAYLLPVAVALSLLGAGELLAMFRRQGHQPPAWAVYGGTLMTVLAAGVPGVLNSDWPGAAAVGQLGWLTIGLAAGLLMALVATLMRFQSPGRASADLALTCFVVLYVGGLMGFMVQLRLLDGRPGNNRYLGMLALVSLIATVKMSDTGQYWVGRRLGRHKLAPVVSPGKTWEGAAGGVVTAIVTAWIIFTAGARGIVEVSAITISPLTIVFFGATVAAAGIIGDLAESLLKRDAGVKDSSTWLPGFGGVLDLLDSLLGAAPVAYLFWVAVILGP